MTPRRRAAAEMPYHKAIRSGRPEGFREPNFHGTPDGCRWTPPWLRGVPPTTSPRRFQGEPFDLVAAMPAFGWQTAVISGGAI